MYTGMYNVSSPVTEISVHYFVCCPNGIYKGNVKTKENIQETTPTKGDKKDGLFFACMWMSCIVDRLLCDTCLLTLVMS